MGLKVSIVGAGGRVGSTAAYALQLGGIAREISLIDVFMAEQVAGEALDLRHGSAFVAPQKFTSGGYDELAGSDVIVITSGLRRKPDEERLALINRNVDMFKGIVAEIKNQKLKDDVVILVVSNPVDILTHMTIKASGLPTNQVIGLGTVLDTARFRSLLADEFDVAATDVNANLLGEHGDTMFPVWSSAAIQGYPLSAIPGFTKEKADAIYERARTSGAEVIKRKGGAGSAVGVSIKTVVEAILLDKGIVLPVSSLQEGLNGVSDVTLSVPTVVGRKGVVQQLKANLSETEQALLVKSADHLKATLAQVA
ncbi:MAG TPA: lactate/malate dehydrogenase family protein [Capsulimonadaceae bacterium]